MTSFRFICLGGISRTPVGGSGRTASILQSVQDQIASLSVGVSVTASAKLSSPTVPGEVRVVPPLSPETLSTSVQMDGVYADVAGKVDALLASTIRLTGEECLSSCCYTYDRYLLCNTYTYNRNFRCYTYTYDRYLLCFQNCRLI